jgi:CRISPR-associated endonuclease/helicase Cas3
MREVIAVCRSSKRARDRVAQVLDRYFWRIGDRTWRGKATNACLDRVSRELRKKASRNTAVVIHEIRSAHESRVPIVRIGARHAFSETGIAPIAARPALFRTSQDMHAGEATSKAVVRIAALFHDLGKATRLFQEKLYRALNRGDPEADPVRHELLSAAVWDHLFGKIPDADLPTALADLTSGSVDAACAMVVDRLRAFVVSPGRPLGFAFMDREESLAHAIGMLILTHHRLPEGDSDLLKALAERHVRPTEGFVAARDLAIAPGVPFWYEPWWIEALRKEAAILQPDRSVIGVEVYLRAALMMADHFGSWKKRPSETTADHLANTIRVDGHTRPQPADSLSQHIRRVYAASRHAVELFQRYADGFPALDESQAPINIAFPQPADHPRFLWQAEATRAARSLCENSEGGFLACLMAGTGTGKSRAAPTILAGAALGDARPERRYFRMSLGLGLRVLATQSADEYVSDLGFNDQDVSVLVGQAPLSFVHGEDSGDADGTGSESLIDIPDWLRVEMARGSVPDPGDEREEDWLRTLSVDTSRGLPAFCDRVLEAAGARATAGRQLLTPPVMVGTIDHLMGVASPVNSRYLVQALRVATSDLILDEIDQFDGEDIAAIGRLVYQAATAGRRVIIMSATLTPDIAEALHAAYGQGWSHFAAARGLRDHVNLLVTGDALGSCKTNAGGESFAEIFAASSAVTLDALAAAEPARRGEILPPCDGWQPMLDQVDDACHRLHDLNAVEIDGFRVSFGMIRMTRIAHTAALAAQLRSGQIDGRLRVTLCLHSQFPRLHRGWIESRLKRALTRKGDDPEAGLRSLCHAEDLFRTASDTGVREIEIVLVTSPVIETGNDLDFDWAILDPISTRSIIQASGRVRRHRPTFGHHVNVLILGRSPIAMQDGKLTRPGVETPLPEDTRVATPHLDGFARRLFSELAGTTDLSVINAAPILSDQGNFPLRDAEVAVRRKLVAADRDAADAPLGRYIHRLNARMTQRMARVRRFRRSDKSSILYKLVGDDFQSATWYRDLAPGTRQSAPCSVNAATFGQGAVRGCHLFGSITERAWIELSEGHELTPPNVSRLMRVEIPDYKAVPDPPVTYTEFTGFTRGSFEDLCEAFGKA